ncbi:hypothetical protein BGZ63DRAFT_421769 [Mariannaea sp. PMI_226]|nr:hypothetical protein BGZ63DRAFT_421769 [Mariannaea sp. PMI_226]
MKKTVFNFRRQICIRQLHYTSGRKLPSPGPILLEPYLGHHTDVQTFREKAFGPQTPCVFAQDDGAATVQLPAASKWFRKIELGQSSGTLPAWTFASHMDQFQDWPFPYELITPTPTNTQVLASFRDWLISSNESADHLLAGILEPSLADVGLHTFFRLFAPLRLLIKALEFNHLQSNHQQEYVNLYIAQSSLPDLPPELLSDLPTPDLVRLAGKGDVYSSSIWLGTEPTYTPLHRDPNPNLFCQLCSTKLIRLMPPALGDRLFYEVQKRIRQQANSRIRTVEMMEGKEREALHEAVWENKDLPEKVYEARLGPGESLFIPNGWWHSVKSKGSHGYLNGSVNWWFR